MISPKDLVPLLISKMESFVTIVDHLRHHHICCKHPRYAALEIFLYSLECIEKHCVLARVGV